MLWVEHKQLMKICIQNLVQSWEILEWKLQDILWIELNCMYVYFWHEFGLYMFQPFLCLVSTIIFWTSLIFNVKLVTDVQKLYFVLSRHQFNCSISMDSSAILMTVYILILFLNKYFVVFLWSPIVSMCFMSLPVCPWSLTFHHQHFIIVTTIHSCM